MIRNMRRIGFSSLRALAAAAWLPMCGCMGSSPAHFGEKALGFGAVVIRSRLVLPTGETREGRLTMNFEAEGGERYRFVCLPDETSLFRIEPDRYRLHPTRNIFGFVQSHIKVHMADEVYSVPFPRSIMRKAAIEVRPRKIVPIGVLEARLLPIKRGRRPKVVVHLDDSVATRRKLIQDLIHRQMDHRTPTDLRDNIISWTRALEESLIRVAGEREKKPAFKPRQ